MNNITKEKGDGVLLYQGVGDSLTVVVLSSSLKVAQELGEEDRATAYQRYLHETENRLKAAQKKSED